MRILIDDDTMGVKYHKDWPKLIGLFWLQFLKFACFDPFFFTRSICFRPQMSISRCASLFGIATIVALAILTNVSSLFEYKTKVQACSQYSHHCHWHHHHQNHHRHHHHQHHYCHHWHSMKMSISSLQDFVVEGDGVVSGAVLVSKNETSGEVDTHPHSYFSEFLYQNFLAVSNPFYKANMELEIFHTPYWSNPLPLSQKRKYITKLTLEYF